MASADAKPQKQELVWTKEGDINNGTSLCGYLTFNAGMYSDAAKRDDKYREFVEYMHSMPARGPTDKAWLSLATYEANVPDKLLREGGIAEWVARLITLSGQPVTPEDDEGKLSCEFGGTYKDQVFRLYDYKGDESIHIGGNPDMLDLVGLRKTLWQQVRESVKPTPFQAITSYHDEIAWGYPAAAAATVDARDPSAIASE
jgi:hypothetical protein